MASNKEQLSKETTKEQTSSTVSAQGTSTSQVEGTSKSYSQSAQAAGNKPVSPRLKQLGNRFKDLFKEELKIEREVKEVPQIPYYVDLKANKFSLLVDSKDAFVEDSAYNMGLSAFVEAAESAEEFHFKDVGIIPEAKPILRDLAIYIHKIYHGSFDWRVELPKTESAALFKDVNMHVADLYYFYKHKITGMLVPKPVLDAIDKGDQNAMRKIENMNTRTILKAHLMQFNKGENKDRMANAFCHLLSGAVHNYLKVEGGINKMLTDFISKHKKFTPTLKMLRAKGKVPDVKIKKYENLFLSNEWEIIKDSALRKAETTLARTLETAITPFNFEVILHELEDIRSSIDDKVSKEIKAVRKERLRVASMLKASSKKGVFNLNSSVANNFGDKKTRDAFNAFRIAFAAERVRIAPSELLGFLTENEELNKFQFDVKDQIDTEGEGRLINALGHELAEYLNR